jgi:hypothetical protein
LHIYCDICADLPDNAYTWHINASVFNGREIQRPNNVLFRASPGDIISTEVSAAELAILQTVIDGTGCTLLLAFIDSNVDTVSVGTDLVAFASYGVATVLDMSSFAAGIQGMRAESETEIGLPLYLASGPIAVSERDRGRQLHSAANDASVRSPSQAEAFVASCIGGPSKSNFIKVLVDKPGFDDTILEALVRAAHGHGVLAVAQALQTIGYSRALTVGFDVIILIPIDGVIEDDVAAALAAHGTSCVPTLTVARAMVTLLRREATTPIPNVEFEYALANIRKLHDAGVRICAGTEANQTLGCADIDQKKYP